MQPEVKDEPKVTEATPVAQEQPAQEEAVPKSSKDWERFREARAQERKQAEEMTKQAQRSAQEAAALKAALDAALNKPQGQSYGYDQPDESEEQRIEKKVNELIQKREAEANKQRQEQERQQMPQMLARNHPDFDQVCTTDNIDYLEFHHPEIALGLKYIPEGYDKWSAIYKAVKKFVPNTNGGDAMKKAEKNLQKPQSVSSPVVGTPGQSLPTILDEARKAANWDRMQKALKGLN